MPTPFKRSPQELHRIYVANTEAFYKVAGRALAPELDAFIRRSALGLSAHSRAISQDHVDAYNQLYSRTERSPAWLLWQFTGEAVKSQDFLPPLFFWALAEKDAKNGLDHSRVFIRMVTNILLAMAAIDDEVSIAEARYITDCTDKLSAICDASGVKKSRAAIDAFDYITTGEPSFSERIPPSGAVTPPVGNPAGEKAPEAPAEKPDLDAAMEELEALTGLDAVKREVKSLVNLMKIRTLRRENELPVPPMSLHLVFTGNPGTGKTTVARLLSRLYAAIGVLSSGQLIEVDRSGLVAGFVGQTALKTGEVIEKSKGGVLFIDEAYSLASGGENDFGREAIETVLKAMEDHRENLVVIAAGYSGPMERFIDSNPGLASRFNKYIRFPDYNGEELHEIFLKMCKKNGYTLDEETEGYAKDYFNEMFENRDDNFGNARDVRNRFEDMVSRHADRVAQLEAPTKEDLCTVTKADLAGEN